MSSSILTRCPPTRSRVNSPSTNMKRFFTIGFVAASLFSALADPQFTSWFTADSGQFAQIYRTDADKFSGRTETTRSNGRQRQWQPAFDGVQEILSSANW